MEIKLDAESLRLMTLFENVTGAQVKDCLEEEDRLTFVVGEEDVGKAIGRQGANLHKLRDILKKDVEVVGWSDDRQKFVSNLFRRFKVESVQVEERRDGTVQVRVRVDAREKGRAIGREGRNIKLARTLAKRHHNVDDVVVD
ncbi:MAG TPA: NusA-like transcription termination signal-binding factor [Candidatus Thermoplasmatota archaeon]|jgi:N utilization substance protein A|nr:NusA-like transcription termination signal-binding factor [Candidatus Thermoplasmatota archaeon]